MIMFVNKIDPDRFFTEKPLIWRIILFAIVVLILMVFFYYVSLLTSYKYYKQQVDFFKEKQHELGELQNKKSRMMLKRTEIITSGAEISFFKQLLKNTTGLKLIGFTKNNQKRVGDVYLSNYTLVFQGEYLTSLKYLQLLKKVNYVIVWYGIDFKVIHYPTGQLILKIGLFSEKKQLFKA